ncbi:MAG: lysophospholipid acyltransferase family protein [Parasphingorhabdus sp.]|nr:lysophospholipid acyltransferase family protein [Parasphingorhabdus sp.]
MIILLLLVLLPVQFLWQLLRLPTPWPQLFLRATAYICGARVSTKGKRLRRDVIYASNHMSWLDIPVIAGATGCTFIANDGIESWPIVGWLCRVNRVIFVSRTDRMKVGDQIAQVRAALEDNYPITIFPEGTTTDGTYLLPFKPSLFAVVAPPPKQMMIQPLWLDYHGAGPEFAWIGEETAPDNARRIFARGRAIRATLHFLEPFDPSALGDRKAICAEVERRIQAMLSASPCGQAAL